MSKAWYVIINWQNQYLMCGWGTFTNFLAYKLERKGGKLVEIDRWFPSSKLCSNCFYQIGEMPLDVREWTCPHCNTHHDRDAKRSAKY